jgi:hypothetical protein
VKHNLRRRRSGQGLVLAALLAAGPGAAWAEGDLAFLPPRALGMGGALRGAAVGSSALALNPSGMSLARSYAVESSYQYFKGLHGHVGTVSVADSTSGFNLGGGIYYTYATADADDLSGDRSRHEGGVALSFPFGDKLTVGGTMRYLRVRRDGLDTIRAPEKINGFTFDAGLTVRPVSFITIGLVGRGLREMDTAQAPRSWGGGVSVVPVPELSLTYDMETWSIAPVQHLLYAGGAEYTFGSRFAVRAGGGHEDGSDLDNSFATAGVSVISEVGALDVGGRLALSGKSRSLYLGFAGRLFVPTP